MLQKGIKRCVIIFFLLLSCVSMSVGLRNRSAVVNGLDGGRFGDKLMGFCKARWVAYLYDVPFFYQPFKYSNYLVMDLIEDKYHVDLKKQFKKTMRLNQVKGFRVDEGCLYEIGFFSQVGNDWMVDNDFKKVLQTIIAPSCDINKPDIPDGRISVALHVRKGGGYDGRLRADQSVDEMGRHYIYSINTKTRRPSDNKWPTKFPPDQYYVDQIKKIYTLFHAKPMHIHLFTDDKNPKAIVDKYKTYLKDLDITFSYRENNNGPNNNVIQDFFAMTYYNCLIRSSSRFSVMAEIIGEFAIVFSPARVHWEGEKLIIDKVALSVNKTRMCELMSDFDMSDLKMNLGI